MAIQIGDEPERVSRLEKFAPWLRRILMLGCLLWAMFEVQTISEDTVSHTIKVTYPLLMGHETLVYRTPAFDPAKAHWQPLNTAVPIRDGDIAFVRAHGAVYAVQLTGQTSQQAHYAWIKIGDSAPPVVAVTEEYPDGIALPGCKIGWSGHVAGQGYLYLDDGFVWGRAPRFELGVPFESGGLETFRHAVRAEVHFESLPWKIPPPDTDDIFPLR